MCIRYTHITSQSEERSCVSARARSQATTTTTTTYAAAVVVFLLAGKCKWFDVSRGYGFVAPDEAAVKRDVFVYQVTNATSSCFVFSSRNVGFFCDALTRFRASP